MSGTSFYHQARNNAWSNHRLLKVCSGLSTADLVAPRTSFFPGILQTLNHILEVDLYYFDALIGGGKGLAHFTEWQDYQGIKELSLAQRQQDADLMAFCDGLSDAQAERSIRIERSGGRIVRETVGATLSHLFVHQIHHRGQVHAMLAGTAVKPPQLDEYYLQFDREFRAPDFRDLGWDEEQ